MELSIANVDYNGNAYSTEVHTSLHTDTLSYNWVCRRFDHEPYDILVNRSTQ